MGRKRLAASSVKAKDEDIYNCLSENEVFADLFNGAVFQGIQVIKPEYLEEMNEKKQLKVPGRDGQPAVIKKLRDVQKGSGLGEGILSLELAAEGQRKVHYGMPVRHMLYDAVDYTKQIQNLEKKHKSSRDFSSGAEFLSGMKREDRLRPIITLAFFYREDQLWDGPMCLHDMLEFPKVLEPWKSYIPNYPLNLVYSGNVNPENFQTGLREVFELLKVAKDQAAMEKFLDKNRARYSDLEWKRGKLIGDFLDIPLIKRNADIIRTEGGGMNMCTAFQQMCMKGEQRGRKLGEERLSKLIQFLFHDNRIEDLQRASLDAEYREILYKEYGLGLENGNSSDLSD